MAVHSVILSHFFCICGKFFAIFASSKAEKHFWHTFGYINNVPQGG